jgi:hypothetical protein
MTTQKDEGEAEFERLLARSEDPGLLSKLHYLRYLRATEDESELGRKRQEREYALHERYFREAQAAKAAAPEKPVKRKPSTRRELRGMRRGLRDEIAHFEDCLATYRKWIAEGDDVLDSSALGLDGVNELIAEAEYIIAEDTARLAEVEKALNEGKP